MGDTYFEDFTQLVLFRLNQDITAAETQAELLASRRTPTSFRLSRIAAAFGLDEAAIQLLALLAATDREPRIWVLARSHHRDPARIGIDCAIASVALDLPVPTLIAAADRLRRLELISSTQSASGYRPCASLFAVPRIVDVLVGASSGDEDLAGVVAPPTPAVELETLVVPDSAVATLRAVLSRRGDKVPVVIMQGIEGVGKRALVSAVAAELGLAMLVIDALELPQDPHALRRVLVALAREARLTEGLVFIDNADALDDHLRRQATSHMLAGLVRAPVLASTGGTIECGPRSRPVVRIDLPVPAAADRAKLWHFHLGDRATDKVVQGLGDRYPITPGLIARASSTALILSPDAVTPEHVKDVVTYPTPPKLASRLPFDSYRTTATS